MYTSLYSIIKKLTTEKKSGFLRLTHDNDQRVFITIQNGDIVGCMIGDLSGAEAGKKLAQWITFQSEFVDNAVLEIDIQKTYHTERFLSLFQRTAEIAQKLMQKVPLNDDNILVFTADGLQGEKKFNMDELSLALALDGKTPTHRVVSDAAVSDLQALIYINGFLQNGLIKRINTNELLYKGQRTSFINNLIEAVAEFVGPAAEIIIEDALQQLECDPKRLYRSELPQLIEAISNYMEEEDRPSFNSWAFGYLKDI